MYIFIHKYDVKRKGFKKHARFCLGSNLTNNMGPGEQFVAVVIFCF